MRADNSQNKYNQKKEFKKNPRTVDGYGHFMPATFCGNCIDSNEHEQHENENNFDRDGYQVQESVTQTGLTEGDAAKQSQATGSTTKVTYFRFVDLPSEIRNQIYELAMHRAKQPVCVPDWVLRPSRGSLATRHISRECKKSVSYSGA